MKKILLIEDEPGLILTLTDRLNSANYAVETAEDGVTGLRLGVDKQFDLIILDVMLPRKNGFEVCRELRQAKITTPVLMLTAKSETLDKVSGLKLGADDYLTKPFAIIELLARVEALLRRAPQQLQNNAAVGIGDAIEIDARRAEVRRAGNLIELSALEFKLLGYLIEHRGEAVSRNELLDHVWGYDAMPTTRTVDVHIAWLRQKLETNPRHPQLILTIHGFGYKFVG